MMKKLVSIIIGLTTAWVAYAQEEDGKGTIDAQRPTLTESYSIVVPQVLQFENGIDFYGEVSDYSYGSFVRGAITDKFELRGFTDYRHLNSVGAKFIVMEPTQTALKLGTSFIYNRDLINNVDDYRLAMTKSFQKLFVTYNVGFNVSIYHIGLLGIPIKDDFSYFVELYNDAYTNRVHTGVTWIPQRDIQLDINGGWMSEGGIYAGLGFSFRLR